MKLLFREDPHFFLVESHTLQFMWITFEDHRRRELGYWIKIKDFGKKTDECHKLFKKL